MAEQIEILGEVHTSDGYGDIRTEFYGRKRVAVKTRAGAALTPVVLLGNDRKRPRAP